MTLTILWWYIPTLLSVFGLLWAFVWPSEAGMCEGVDRLVRLAVSGFVCAVAWAVAAVLK